MDDKVGERVSFNSLQQGELYLAKGNFGRAFAHFLVALKLNPNYKEELKLKFANCIEKWGLTLEKENRFDDLFNCYEQAIEIFPENELIYYHLGFVLIRGGSPKEAADYFRKYVASDPYNLKARRHLENACNSAVERWHYRMLNDQIRNLAFREAIVKKVKRGFHSVIDIGTGTGLLSLFALEGGATDVYACDSSSAMTAIASQVFEHHGIPNIKLINKHSTDLTVPEDLDRRVSLVVCEIVDCGLLGEHVLETLVHAWEELLQPNGVVLPLAAALHICAIQSKDISRMWKLQNTPALFGLENYNLEAIYESYDTEKLSKLPNGFARLTETEIPLTIEFNDPEEMREILEGEKDKEVTLTCIEPGDLDCIAVWFTLRIDEDIALQTGPESPVQSWEQAIFPVSKTKRLKLGEEVKVKVSFKAGKLGVRFLSMEDSESERFMVSQRVLKILNNVQWVNAMQVAAKTTRSLKKQSLRVLDLNAFPVFGLEVMKQQRAGGQLVCLCLTPHDKEFISQVVKDLGCAQGVLCLTEDTIEELIEKEQKFDVIVVPLIEESGELNEKFWTRREQFRKCLRPDGLILPECLTIYGQVVDSQWLQEVSRVKNIDVTCGYEIAPFINMYSINQQINFNINAVPYTARSETIEFLKLLTSDDKDIIELEHTATITKPGSVTAILYWYEMNILKNQSAVSTKCEESHINQSAQLLDIQATETLTIVFKYENGLIGFKEKNMFEK